MQFRDMKEMDIKEWDGKPFKAYTTNFDNRACDHVLVTVTGFNNGQWMTSGTPWAHVYPVEWNKPKPKRMTNRQLSLWLRQGNGECTRFDGSCIWSGYSYPKGKENEEVTNDIRVRTWDSYEWIEPTTDLLKGDN